MSATVFLGQGGHGGSAVPYQLRNADPTAAVSTSPQDSLRLRRYQESWRFYVGHQWSFEREGGNPLVTANYARTIVNKKASWLVGKGIAISVCDALVHHTKPVLEDVWKEHKPELMKMAVTGGVTGDVFVLVTATTPTTEERKRNPHKRGKVRIRLLGSHQVFPVWDPRDTNSLLSVRIVTTVADANQREQGDVRRNPGLAEGTAAIGSTNRRQYIEDISATKITEGWIGKGMTTRNNTLGEIPLVHITNEAVPNEYYGVSDLEGLIDMQREFNEKMTDVSDTVHYHASPITVILGAKVSSLEKGANKLWAFTNPNVKVMNLQLDGDLGAQQAYLKLVQQVMFDISGIPEGALGRMQSISNTSQAALQVQFQPLVEATERKSLYYEAGLRQINYFILRWHEELSEKRFPVDLCRNCGGRIVLFADRDPDTGEDIVRRKCYHVDPHTLRMLKPEEVKLKLKREHSFGTETREVTFEQAKREAEKRSASYWDPAPTIDKRKEAEALEAEAKKQLEEQEAEESDGEDAEEEEGEE